MKETNANGCLYPECDLKPRSRGLCASHYEAAAKLLRSGVAKEQDLVRRNLMRAKRRTIGEVFKLGSRVRGSGKD